MITSAQIQRHATQAGQNARFFEIEVILTYILQMFIERDLGNSLAFKGGTFLRKMVFGPGGRLSTDLDFTSVEAIDPEDMLLKIMIALDKPYLGLSFSYQKDKDFYATVDGCSANPIVRHAGNQAGIKIKIQVSLREQPTLPVDIRPQLPQHYFKDLEFEPAPFPCLAKVEVISEKIRAGQQRVKIRDLWDLNELSTHAFDRELVRNLAVLKVWQAPDGEGFSHQSFQNNIQKKEAYDSNDLKPLLRKDKAKVDVDGMINKVRNHYMFLAQLSADENTLAADVAQRRADLHAVVRDRCVALKVNG